MYKGLLVVFGLFLAYESRNVKYFKINDSRFVSIAMYIVVILIGIGAPLSLVLSVYQFADPAYALSVFMIVASTMSCLLIIHVPKVSVPTISIICTLSFKGINFGKVANLYQQKLAALLVYVCKIDIILANIYTSKMYKTEKLPKHLPKIFALTVFCLSCSLCTWLKARTL